MSLDAGVQQRDLGLTHICLGLCTSVPTQDPQSVLE